MGAWGLVLAAGVFEVGFALSLKFIGSDLRWIAVLAVCAPASFALLVVALRTLPIGSVYAVWTGIGIAGTVLVGILAFGEQATPARLGAVLLIVLGIVAVQATGGQA